MAYLFTYEAADDRVDSLDAEIAETFIGQPVRVAWDRYGVVRHEFGTITSAWEDKYGHFMIVTPDEGEAVRLNCQNVISVWQYEYA